MSEFKHNFAYHVYHSSLYTIRPFFSSGCLIDIQNAHIVKNIFFVQLTNFFSLSYRCMCVKIVGIQLRSPKFIICIWKTTIPLVRLFINFMTRGISSLQMQTLLTCYFKWTLKKPTMKEKEQRHLKILKISTTRSPEGIAFLRLKQVIIGHACLCYYNYQ